MKSLCAWVWCGTHGGQKHILANPSRVPHARLVFYRFRMYCASKQSANVSVIASMSFQSCAQAVLSVSAGSVPEMKHGRKGIRIILIFNL